MTAETGINLFVGLVGLAGLIVPFLKRGNGAVKAAMVRWYLRLSGAAILIQATLAVLGHMLRDQRLSNFNQTVPMAVSTAVCLVFVGVGLILIASQLHYKT